MFLGAVFTVFETALLGITTFFNISFIRIRVIRVFLLFSSSPHFRCMYFDVIWFCKTILFKKTSTSPQSLEHTVFNFQNIEDNAV